jgi:hypothetical protein
MKPIHISKTVLLLSGILLVQTSCKKFIELKSPPDKIETANIFLSNETAISATVGLYSKMLQLNLGLVTAGTTLYAGVSADEIYNTSTTVAAEAFRSNSLLPTNSTIAGTFWSTPYGFIYQANSVLEGLAASPVLADSLKRQLKGEMLVTRTFIYFYMLNLYGEVPFQTTTNFEVNAVMPRTPVTTIYQHLIADLQEAQGLLKSSYPSANRVRPNRWTATALLARIYLYTGDFVNAEIQANSLITTGGYTLSSIPTVFTSISSNETIWYLIRDNGNTSDGSTFIPSSTTTRPAYPITSYLYAAFETGDQRKTTGANGWLGKNTNSGVDYYYPYKYKQPTPPTGISPTEYLVVFRLAEQYLIRAEARAKQNNLTGAIQDINMIRNRAGLPNLTSSLNQTQVLTAVEQERRVELFAEWGHRWFDLKRTGRADMVLGPIKTPNWQSTDVLFPIPQTELNLNVFLVQNPGY